ncbi:radical SAM protein [Paenibacillus sp. HN-1]|uniref:radical SAM protein n=1 Tax=Paenibacillus TaxID=44249 RepID=UPI001CA8C886|nr:MULTISPECIES: radical SAM protein [Paenibacillus]MBY9077399.1 radical SAM protein [Paenibacillus sp. CGMCC 1.18879]MBY9087492.1 radical SAM protein [Paenibacillus sinensis]
MASVIINSACNLQCPFCFATESRNAEGHSINNMSKDEFHKILKFDSNIVTTICGGEPTIHPEFCDFMDSMLAVRGKYINVLTNGLWPEKVCNYFSSLPFEKSKRIIYLFNILQPEEYTEAQVEKLHAALGSVNPETAFVGFTIYKYPFDYSYIFDIAKKFGINHIRYSVAAPNVTDQSSWNIDPDKDFRECAKVVYNFVMDASKQGFEVNPDCGYLPPCAYTKEELADLLLVQPGVKFKCSAVTDIGKDGESWRCYSLYSVLRSNMENFQNINEMAEYFNKRSELLLDIDLFDKCKDCQYKISGICHGGCFGYRIIKGLKEDENYNFFPIDDEEALMNCIPVINKKVLKIWKKNKQDEPLVYLRDEWKLQTRLLNFDEFLNDFIEACSGKESVAQIIDKLTMSYGDRERCRNNVIQAVNNLFQQNALKITRS